MRFVVSFSLLLITCTQNNNSAQEKQISKDVYDKLYAGCSNISDRDVVIYYFDADCALCMAEVLDLETKVKKENGKQLLLIAKTLTPERFAYQAKQQGVQSCILFDTEEFFTDEFELNSKTLLSKNRLLLDYRD